MSSSAGQHLSIVEMGRRKPIKPSRKRISSPNITSTAIPSPDCSPIKRDTSLLNLSTSPGRDFSPRSPNQTNQSESEMSSIFNLSYLNKTWSIENILKSKNMEKYVEIFDNNKIYNLAAFASLTEQDLVNFGIDGKKDRLRILEMIAACKGEI